LARFVVCAVDCGFVVNPDTIVAQVEGGSLFGLTAALYGLITVKNGRIEQSNFHDYRPMRMNETPVIETHIVKSTEAPGGFGEAPTSIVAPAAIRSSGGHGILARDGYRRPAHKPLSAS
jgi:isoquinoline 1-oxidoreductase beta subunit